MIKRMIFSFAVLLCSLPVVPTRGYNPAYQINAVAGSTPNIDGVMTSDEWNDASIVSDLGVYAKQDGRSLYVAFNVSDSTAEMQDTVAIFVDLENNGGASPQPDDFLFGILRSGQLIERQGSNDSGPPSGGWSGSAFSTGNLWQAEFNITYAKIGITPGEAKTLGMALEKWNFVVGYPFFWPPMTPAESNSPSNWGNMVSEQTWLPEFPSFIILPLFMLLTMVAIVFMQRRIPRKQKNNR